ncbi:MAG TPA: nickel-dependent hydrogenase large subunit [Methanomassiliicoccales archaeon]|nr:nickel-dependent hydrogenase large subunit [Methanomassiliicoccales archaeon]HXZ23303.1 nickel-dependent hydrogenase large subunit [Methanomassiliicoccales archaeon]
MPGLSTIPFGPQHSSFLEPLHLKLVMDEERVAAVELSQGYNHRGMEYAMEQDWKRNVFLSERVCGICSFHHSTTYCQTIEAIANVEVPERAKLIRTIMLELQRVTSHTLALGHIAEAAGYENLFMQFFREREEFMRLVNLISGNRVHYSMNAVGGVRRDITPELEKAIETKLNEMRPKLEILAGVIRRDSTWLKRTKGVGVLSKKQAETWCVVGPVARASGLPYDVRLSGNAAYYLDGLKFEPVWREEGDTWARAMVRMDETLQSVDLVHQCLGMMRDGPILAPFKGNPTGEGFSRNEAPRGELFYWIKAKGETKLDRCKVRTPAFVNIPPLMEMLPNCHFPDVPVIVVSVDPCVCCTDR